MRTPSCSSRACRAAAAALLLILTASTANAVEALLLQDAYVDSSTSGKPVPNLTNYGSTGNLRVTRNGTQVFRSFLKFSLATLPSGAAADTIVEARLKLWVNNTTTILGSFTITPVTSSWDELTITNNATRGMTFGSAQLVDIPANSSSDFISIDVTTLVKSWM